MVATESLGPGRRTAHVARPLLGGRGTWSGGHPHSRPAAIYLRATVADGRAQRGAPTRHGFLNEIVAGMLGTTGALGVRHKEFLMLTIASVPTVPTEDGAAPQPDAH